MYYKFNQLALPIGLFVLLLLYWLYISGIAQCPILEITGKPCCTCGVTRDISQMMTGSVKGLLNPMSIYILIWVTVQVIYRLVVIAMMRHKKASTALVVTDIVITFGSLIAIAVTFCS